MIEETQADREQDGWDWLANMVECIADEHPSDLTYSADQMVDAFVAGGRRHTHPASTEPADALDWLKIAALAGEHGIRYRTNRGMAAFLAALTRTDALAEARDALEPFGNEEIIAQLEGDDDEEWAKFGLLVKDHRRAAAALSRLNSQGEGK